MLLTILIWINNKYKHSLKKASYESGILGN